ncbi:MAG TPA: hypothetical protein VKO87_16045 [Gemmatimonadaceae bacterium]|nr:hypothetical protein [Gemmatimonadaceae bacterium]
MPIANNSQPSVRRTQRVIAAIVVGLIAALVHYVKIKAVPDHPGDFGLAWFGARAMLHGGNPYELIGPGLVYDWPWRLIYPLTAMAAALPFALFAQTPATLAFVFASGALLAYSVTRNHWYPLLMCTSAAFLIAAGAAQWSPLFTAAMGLPPLALFFAAKPTVGFALALAGSRDVRKFAVIGTAILMIVSLALFPRWPLEWYRSLSTATQVAPPILRFGGVAVLFALLRWRRWDARLIVALACVPQTGSWYEILPLFLVPANATEMMALVAISSSGYLLQDFIMTALNETQYNQQVGSMMVALGYLPAVIMVLRRPNRRVEQ